MASFQKLNATRAITSLGLRRYAAWRVVSLDTVVRS